MIAQVGGFMILVGGWTFLKVRSLAMNGKKKEAALYGGLMGLTLVFGSLLIAKVELPSFILPFKLLFEPIGRKLMEP